MYKHERHAIWAFFQNNLLSSTVQLIDYVFSEPTFNNAIRHEDESLLLIKLDSPDGIANIKRQIESQFTNILLLQIEMDIIYPLAGVKRT